MFWKFSSFCRGRVVDIFWSFPSKALLGAFFGQEWHGSCSDDALRETTWLASLCNSTSSCSLMGEGCCWPMFEYWNWRVSDSCFKLGFQIWREDPKIPTWNRNLNQVGSYRKNSVHCGRMWDSEFFLIEFFLWEFSEGGKCFGFKYFLFVVLVFTGAERSLVLWEKGVKNMSDVKYYLLAVLICAGAKKALVTYIG